MSQAGRLGYKNQRKRPVSSGNTGKVIYGQIQQSKYDNKLAELEMGRTLTVDPLSHTEHQGMSSIPSQSRQNTRKENQNSFLESAQNNDEENNGLVCVL